ncbi:MAG: hypothetical protein ABIY70_06480 [Capsulimonas sp.]|uniref:hypothetical protein n=1 Tax=Capsulimonas sp. TaxID=2494211 RepID=UPI0032630998
MILSAIGNLTLLLPVLLAATPPQTAPTPTPAVIHLVAPVVTTAPATAPCRPLLVGQWMTLNKIPHTAPFVPEPILVDTRCTQ